MTLTRFPPVFTKKTPAVRRVSVKQLTERIGIDTLRFLCHYDLWRSCRQPPWLSQRESQVPYPTHCAKRRTEVRFFRQHCSREDNLFTNTHLQRSVRKTVFETQKQVPETSMRAPACCFMFTMNLRILS